MLRNSLLGPFNTSTVRCTAEATAALANISGSPPLVVCDHVAAMWELVQFWIAKPAEVSLRLGFFAILTRV